MSRPWYAVWVCVRRGLGLFGLVHPSCCCCYCCSWCCIPLVQCDDAVDVALHVDVVVELPFVPTARDSSAARHDWFPSIVAIARGRVRWCKMDSACRDLGNKCILVCCCCWFW